MNQREQNQELLDQKKDFEALLPPGTGKSFHYATGTYEDTQLNNLWQMYRSGYLQGVAKRIETAFQGMQRVCQVIGNMIGILIILAMVCGLLAILKKILSNFF